MKKRILISLIVALALVVASLAGCKNKNSSETSAVTEPTAVSETTAETSTTAALPTEVTVSKTLKEMKQVVDSKIIAGLKDLAVAVNTKANILSLLAVNRTLVTDISLNSSKVDFSKEGEYKAVYTIKFDNNAVKDYESLNRVSFGLPKDADIVIVTVTVNITVVSKETAASLNVSNKEPEPAVITDENAQAFQKFNEESVGSDSANAADIHSEHVVDLSKPETQETTKTAQTNNNGNDNKQNDSNSSSENNPNSNNDSNSPTTQQAADPTTSYIPSETQTERPTEKPTERPTEPPTTQHVHNYVSRTTKDATCESDGTITYTCSCGSSYTESIPATGHDIYVASQTNAGCETGGSVTYACSKCSVSWTETTAALGHDWQNRTEHLCIVHCQNCNQAFYSWGDDSAVYEFMDHAYTCWEHNPGDDIIDPN